MMIWLKLIFSFIRALNEKASPRALSGGFALGAIIGLTPKGSLHNAVVLLLIFLLPVNKAASLVSVAAFSLFAAVGDPLFNKVGDALLLAPSLQGFWTWCYNTPVLPWTRFNNTLVLGSLTTAILMWAPLFMVSTKFVVHYREKALAWAARLKLFQIMKASKLYSLYEKFS